MTTSRLITRSACALGAAMLATTVLQSTPAEARGKAGGHTRVSAHSVGHKVSSRISQELPGQHNPTPGGGGGGGGKQVEVPQSKPGDGGRPVPPGGIPSGPSIPATPPPTSTGGVHPPIGTPTQAPIPPVLNPGNVPGTKQPPGPKPVPPPGTNAGGGTGPNNPDYPGGSRPPIFTGTPTRAPIPPITSGGAPPPVPSPGTGTSYTQHGQVGVYAGVGAGGDGYAPCQWFKDNYDRTGSVYWLNRYKVCLWQH